MAFASQSGAFGIAALDLAAERGVGLSSFVSMGAKADLSGNDLLQFWEQLTPPPTCAALSGVVRQPAPLRAGRPPRDGRKPVIAVKSGRAAGRRAAGASQTSVLARRLDTHVDALFRHAG